MSMLPAYMIEVGDEPVGVAMPEQDALIFHASHPAVQALHGRRFSTPTEMEREAAVLLRRAA